MNFPVTLDKIRAYEEHLASGIEEAIYTRIKPYMKINPIQIISDLSEQIQRNVRAKVCCDVYTANIGNYETLLRDFSRDDIERVVKKRFTDELIRNYFPDAEVLFKGGNYCITLEWTMRR